MVKGVLRLGRIWLAAFYVWGASGWLVRDVLRLGASAWLVKGVLLPGRIWLTSEEYLTSGAHLVGWLRGVLCPGRIWLAIEGYLTSGAHLIGQ